MSDKQIHRRMTKLGSTELQMMEEIREETGESVSAFLRRAIRSLYRGQVRDQQQLHQREQ